MLEGARTILLVSGLNEPWWPLAVRHWSFAYNIDQGALGDSPYNRRHLKGQFTKQRAPFGSLIDFEPVPAKQKEELKIGPKAIPGISLDGTFWQAVVGMGFLRG